MKRRKKEEKALGKLMETKEEKMKRRLAKKQKKHGNAEPEDAPLGYTDEANPFGDTNLSERFLWKKKTEKLKAEGKAERPLTAREEQQRRAELIHEVERIKQRREQRELEKEQREEEAAMMNRERERQSYQEWERKDDEFHLEQTKKRAKIRLKEGRAKPIDILAKNLQMIDENDSELLEGGFEVEMSEPYSIFTGLPLPELESLRADITSYVQIRDRHIDFWEALLHVCEDEIEQARLREEERSRRKPTRGEMGLHVSVKEEVYSILQGKTYGQLERLHEQITKRLNARDETLDVDYWQGLLKRLTVQKAKARLREMHAEILQKRLQALEREVEEESKRALADPTAADNLDDDDEVDALWDNPDDDQDKARKQPAADDDDEDFSPELMAEDDVAGGDVVDEQEDAAQLDQQRREILGREASKLALSDDQRRKLEEEMYRTEASKLMEDGEVKFGDEVALDNTVYSWHDKFRPRKPRYFNRVHTGYEWNKYNQTHYDHDNPPPKWVQGYKFNIFYPDLIDKTKAPTYYLEKSDTAETALLRFHAGPPYEDVAFKICNREWQLSNKFGFRVVFERGVLQLYFNFKRWRYRR